MSPARTFLCALAIVLFTCMLALASSHALVAKAKDHAQLNAVGKSSTGEVLRGGASLRAAITPPDQQFAVGGAAMQAAASVARAYWGADPCGNQVDIRWTDQSNTINAVSSWKNPTSSYDNPAQNLDCEVDFNRDLSYDWPRFCTVLVHEFGHLTGHQHSEDPNDVMAAYYNRPLAQCQATPDPTAAPAPAPAPPVAVTATPASAESLTVILPRSTPAPKARVARAKPAARKHRTRKHTRHHRRAHHLHRHH